jgi:hypothetical protein
MKTTKRSRFRPCLQLSRAAQKSAKPSTEPSVRRLSCLRRWPRIAARWPSSTSRPVCARPSTRALPSIAFGGKSAFLSGRSCRLSGKLPAVFEGRTWERRGAVDRVAARKERCRVDHRRRDVVRRHVMRPTIWRHESERSSALRPPPMDRRFNRCENVSEQDRAVLTLQTQRDPRAPEGDVCPGSQGGGANVDLTHVPRLQSSMSP